MVITAGVGLLANKQGKDGVTAFSEEWMQRNDPPSRKTVINFYKRFGVNLKDGPNKYKIDLISEDGEILVEVERRGKEAWLTGDFPFPTVCIPSRKKGWFNQEAQYAVCSQDLTH